LSPGNGNNGIGGLARETAAAPDVKTGQGQHFKRQVSTRGDGHTSYEGMVRIKEETGKDEENVHCGRQASKTTETHFQEQGEKKTRRYTLGFANGVFTCGIFKNGGEKCTGMNLAPRIKGRALSEKD